jgi:hypothetical protein
MFPTWNDWDISYTRKGQVKKFAMTLLRIVALVATIISSMKLRRSLRGQSIVSLLKANFRTAFLTGAGVLQNAASRVK